MKATESEIAPSLAGQSLKMCLPGRERGKEELSGIQGETDRGRWWGNHQSHLLSRLSCLRPLGVGGMGGKKNIKGDVRNCPGSQVLKQILGSRPFWSTEAESH